MFALCDVNAFYASCETVFRPDLWGKPVVVLSNNDGCVIARNAEAKALGVKMGDPGSNKKICFVAVAWFALAAIMSFYADMSNRVMSTLEELSPRVEIYSIDEAFCDLTGVRNCRDLTDFGREIRATVLQRTHLTVGVGIAQTKTLAKLANHAAKKWQRQTGGVVDLSNLERQRKLMSALPVDDVWGIGRRISKKLDAMGSKPFSIWRIQISGLSVNILMSCSKERCVNCAANPVCNWKSLHRRSRKLSVPARLVNASRIIRRCGRPFVVTLPGRRKNFAASINIVGLSPRLLRRHHLRSMNLITAIARR